MIPEKFLEVLSYEGVVAIATQGDNEPHLVNTWNSYIIVTKEGNMLYPAGGMNKTEANIKKNNNVLITLGSREVQGFHTLGTGFQIKGTATFLKSGDNFNLIKQKFSWARAAVEVKIISVTQTL